MNNISVEQITNNFSFIYNTNYQSILTTIFVCILFFYAYYETDDKFYLFSIILIILCLTLILYKFIDICKNTLKTIRPCNQNNNEIKLNTDYCPNSYDIPSGHSALGIFHGMILYGCGYEYLSIYFFIQPILRYIGSQHTMTAIVSGGFIGMITYYIFILLNNKN